MKSFLCRDKKPIIKWTRLPDNTFFEGELPEGYSLAVVPGNPYIIVDVDKHEDKEDGFKHIPDHLKEELGATLNYPTKNKGRHYWFKYKGKAPLANKPSGLGIDLRIGNKGYVVWYPKTDIRDHLDEINETSEEMNIWLESILGRLTKERK